jgi:hypothetical protein
MQLYDEDIVAWAREQARQLRAGRFELLDLEHLAEEIEDVGRSEQRELASRMTVLLAHLLKWRYQPDRRGVSWQVTLSGQRERLVRRLEKTPSLKAVLSDPDWWADAWLDARIEAAKETGVEIQRFPATCPWTVEQVLGEGWLPE